MLQSPMVSCLYRRASLCHPFPTVAERRCSKVWVYKNILGKGGRLHSKLFHYDRAAKRAY